MASFAKRVHDALWRLRHPEYERPCLVSARWLPPQAVERIEALLRARPLTIVDGGTRGGVRDLRELRHLTRAYGFEPNEAECLPLQREWHAGGYLDAAFLPVALAEAPGTRELKITAVAGATSYLDPDPHALGLLDEAYERYFDVVRTETVPTTSLDAFAESEGVEQIDFVKLDTQGSELEIIRGGRRLFRDSVLVVESEIWFKRVYEGQPLLRDLDTELAGLGFSLLAIENAFQPESIRPRRGLEPGTADRGEWVWGDGVWVKDVLADPSLVPADDPARAIRFVLVLESLGFIGYALGASRHFRATGVPDADLLEALERAILTRHRLRGWEHRVPKPLARRVLGRPVHAPYSP